MRNTKSRQRGNTRSDTPETYVVVQGESRGFERRLWFLTSRRLVDMKFFFSFKVTTAGLGNVIGMLEIVKFVKTLLASGAKGRTAKNRVFQLKNDLFYRNAREQ